MAGHCLPAVELTGSGRPVLLPNEIECYLLSAVDLLSEDDPSNPFPHLKSGILILTTHRLLWLLDSATATGSSAFAIPLGAISYVFTPKKSLKSMFASPRIRFQLSLSSNGRVNVSGSISRSVVVTIVIRGKGDSDVFLSKFWECWRSRAWELQSEPSSSSGSGSNTSSSGMFSSDGTLRMVGVSGILRKEQESWESTDRSLQEAFQDLNALMVIRSCMLFISESILRETNSALC